MKTQLVIRDPNKPDHFPDGFYSKDFMEVCRQRARNVVHCRTRGLDCTDPLARLIDKSL
jgi:hypothetical protein